MKGSEYWKQKKVLFFCCCIYSWWHEWPTMREWKIKKSKCRTENERTVIHFIKFYHRPLPLWIPCVWHKRETPTASNEQAKSKKRKKVMAARAHPFVIITSELKFHSIHIIQTNRHKTTNWTRPTNRPNRYFYFVYTTNEANTSTCAYYPLCI